MTLDIIDKAWLVLPGGSDINPAIYKKPNYKSYVSTHSKYRDKQEIANYKKAIKQGRPILGICRGHQLISALNGLTLIQDMNHPVSHEIYVRDLKTDKFTKKVKVNSAHHQLVWTNNKLEGDDFKVYGHCLLSKHHYYDLRVSPIVTIEPEIIHFPKINALGVQFHPEWMTPMPHDMEFFEYDDDSRYYNPVLDYLKDLINKLF
jgi:gamma-glutamyl-gamma-aminobutyrate hydrolase PuuD